MYHSFLHIDMLRNILRIDQFALIMRGILDIVQFILLDGKHLDGAK